MAATIDVVLGRANEGMDDTVDLFPRIIVRFDVGQFDLPRVVTIYAGVAASVHVRRPVEVTATGTYSTGIFRQGDDVRLGGTT